MLRLRKPVWLLLALLLALPLACARVGPPKQPVSGPLKALAVFYGWPSQVNGATSVDAAARVLARSDVLVIGWGLQRPDHGDHHPTRRIVASLGRRGVEVYGYVPLGPTEALSASSLTRAIGRWRALGVSGIFFDEAGYDYNTSRARQNRAFTEAHRLGLRAFANAWDPGDLFDDSPRPVVNPRGSSSVLGRGDCYLYESFGLRRGGPEPSGARRDKLEALAPARRRGVRVFGVTTAAPDTRLDRHTWGRLTALARRAGLEGLGWGGHLFGARDNRLRLPSSSVMGARR